VNRITLAQDLVNHVLAVVLAAYVGWEAIRMVRKRG